MKRIETSLPETTIVIIEELAKKEDRKPASMYRILIREALERRDFINQLSLKYKSENEKQ